MSCWPSPAPLFCPSALGTRQRNLSPLYMYSGTHAFALQTYNYVHIITNSQALTHKTDNYKRPKEYICTLILKGVRKRTLLARWLTDICLQWGSSSLFWPLFILSRTLVVMNRSRKGAEGLTSRRPAQERNTERSRIEFLRGGVTAGKS